MRILVLGGTRFVGRHIAQAAIAAGHEVTFAHRGITGPSLFPNQTHVRIDRHGSAEILASIETDIVIDTSGYTPDSVRASALAVANRVQRYIFMSSIDAYDLRLTNIDETSPTKALPPGATTSEIDEELYGAHKAQCERELANVLGPERVLVVRAGLMAGPHDHTDRFTYWPARISHGGDLLTPVGPALRVQFIDVRDVAQWIVGSIERELAGTFNLVGTPGAVTFGDILQASIAATGAQVRPVWASTAFLLTHEVGPWIELPLWLPPSPELAGLLGIDNTRALANGLRLRPLDATVRDVLADYRSRSAPRGLSAGLQPERERALIAALGNAASIGDATRT